MPVVTPDYGTPDFSSRLAIPSTIFAVVTPVLVLLRCAFSNAQKDIGPDDWSMLVSVAFSEAICILLIVVGNFPLGENPMDLQTRSKEKWLRMLFAVRLLYQITIGITKISVAQFLLKAFGIFRWCRVVCWCLVLFIAVFTVGTLLTSALACYPVSLDWSGTFHTSPACIDRSGSSIAITVFDVLAWILLIAVGVISVSKMEIKNVIKATAGVVFPLGMCLCVGSILRAITYKPILDTHSVDTTVHENLCILCEACLGIIFASIPTFFRPLRRVSASILTDVREADEMSLGACAGDEESAMPLPTPTPTTPMQVHPDAVHSSPFSPSKDPESILPFDDSLRRKASSDQESAKVKRASTPSTLLEAWPLPPDAIHVDPFVPSQEPEDILRAHASHRRSLHVSLRRFSSENHARNVTSPLEDPSLLEDAI